MTWIELAEKIKEFSVEQKKSDITLFVEDEDEYYPCFSLKIADSNQDIIDEGLPILVVRG